MRADWISLLDNIFTTSLGISFTDVRVSDEFHDGGVMFLHTYLQRKKCLSHTFWTFFFNKSMTDDDRFQ